MYVVTLNRQFGSLGRPIARRMAEILDINYYDRDIVERTASSLNLSVSTISAVEEYATSRFSFMCYPLGDQSPEVQDQIYKVQEKIIRDLAAKESCIIVGRCADYILKDFENRIDIYIVAPYQDRYDNCIHQLYMEPKEAKYMMKTVDKARDVYHKKYSGYLLGDYRHKDVILNSSLLGVEGTAQYLSDLVIKKFDLKKKEEEQ